MKFSFSIASLAAIGLLSLLSACASSTSPDTQQDAQKVASNCEVVTPSVGSNMSHRHCEPGPAGQGNPQPTSH